MKKIDFTKLKMFTDISNTNCSEQNVCFELSNLIYTRASGIFAHALAMKIYKSTGEIELTDEEFNFIVKFANENLVPLFMDSLKANIIDVDDATNAEK